MKFVRYLLATVVLATSWLGTGNASPTQVSPQAQSAGRLIHDVSTGRSYREQTISVNVPTTTWETQPMSQTVYAPKYVTSYVPTQNLVYTPRTTYVLQSRVRGRFNPFRQTVLTYEYRPVTNWQPTLLQSNVAVTSQQWVASQQTVMVSKPVQRTETRQQIVYHEVSPQPQNADVTIASRTPAVYTLPGREPLLGQGRLLARLGNGGLRPVSNSTTQLQSNLQAANYSAPLRSASRSPQSARDPLQAGLNATILR